MPRPSQASKLFIGTALEVGGYSGDERCIILRRTCLLRSHFQDRFLTCPTGLTLREEMRVCLHLKAVSHLDLGG